MGNIPEPSIEGPYFQSDDATDSLSAVDNEDEIKNKSGQEIDDVKKLQLLLKKYGRYKGKIDGWYGPKLAAAVQEFQKDNALKTDSVFGPKTRAALMAPRLDDKGDDYEDSPCPYAPDGPAVKYYVGRSPGYMPRKEVVEEITSALKQWSDASGVNEFLFDGKGGELARAGM